MIPAEPGHGHPVWQYGPEPELHELDKRMPSSVDCGTSISQARQSRILGPLEMGRCQAAAKVLASLGGQEVVPPLSTDLPSLGGGLRPRTLQDPSLKINPSPDQLHAGVEGRPTPKHQAEN